MNDKMQKAYYAIIPANIRYDKEIPSSGKLLYGEITALCNEKGYCWASNEYFADLYQISKRQISKLINQLIEKGYLDSELQYKNGTKQVDERRLYIASEFHTPRTKVPQGIEEKFHTPRKKVPQGIEEKFHIPMEQKFQDNNTSFNNTENNTLNNTVNKKHSAKAVFEEHTQGALLETLLDFLEMRNQAKAKMTQRAAEMLLNELDKLANNDIEKIKILEQSIMNSWKGVFPIKQDRQQQQSKAEQIMGTDMSYLDNRGSVWDAFGTN